MSRDMKSSRTNRSASSNSSSKNGGSSLITGLLLGLFVGIAIAVVVALVLNRSGNPFKMDKTTPPDAIGSAPETAVAPPEVLHPGNGKELPNEVEPTAAASAAASKPAAANASEERFDFYKVLPELNDKPAAETKAVDAKPVASKASAVKASAAKASAPKPVSSAEPKAVSNAWLQVGAFKDEGDADNLKAKLALLGIESKILTSDVPDKGIWHRVRVGPFNSAADIDKVRGQLKTNGIDSAVIKAN
jgi:cell division protein FtsN